MLAELYDRSLDSRGALGRPVLVASAGKEGVVSMGLRGASVLARSRRANGAS